MTSLPGDLGDFVSANGQHPHGKDVLRGCLCCITKATVQTSRADPEGTGGVDAFDGLGRGDAEDGTQSF